MNKRDDSMEALDRNILRSIKPTMRERLILDIMRDYDFARRRYFGNRVLDVSNMGFVVLSTREIESRNVTGCIAYCVHHHAQNFGLIAIRKEAIRPERWMSLVHEMAHLSVERKYKRPLGHGKIWQSEMKRIAKAGAFKGAW